jgi:SHAQKYF class myb-like DNA-binding protein
MMNAVSVVSALPEPLQSESFVQVPHAVRIVVPSASTVAYDVPVVTPIESFPDLSDNSITDSNHGKVGRWTEQEHTVFLEGLEKHGKQWKTIAAMIGTRSVVQVRTHAQKYFQKMERKKNASSTSIWSSDSFNDDSDGSQPKRKSFSIASSSSKKSKTLPEGDSYQVSTAVANVMEMQSIPQIIPSTEL